MRRAIFAVTGLAASTTLLVVLKAAPASTPTAQGGTEPPPVAPAPADPAAGTPPAPSGAAGTRAPGPTVTTRAPASRPRTTAPGGGRAPNTPRTTAAAPSTGPRTHYGSVVRTTPDRSFGNVQVQITVLDGRVTDVTTLEMPEDTPESVRRTDDVNRAWSGPQGAAARAANGGANLDTVSGATSTCNAYEQSLQAALDRAGLR